MVALNAHSVSIGGRAYNPDKSGYPIRPTVYSGVEISFGAPSCIEHPEATTANISLWVPKTHVDYLPKLGEEVIATARFESDRPATVFAGNVDQVILQDDHKPAESYDPASYYGTTVYSLNNTALGSWYISGQEPRVHTASLMNGVLTVLLDENVMYDYDYEDTVLLYVQNLQKIAIQPEKKYTVEAKITGALGQVRMSFWTSNGTFLGNLYVEANSISTITTPANATQMAFGEATLGALKGFPEVFIGPFVVRDPATATPAPDSVPGYRVNIQCSDAVAAAGRLRIGTTPWNSADAYQRLSQIAELSAPSGVKFLDPGYLWTDQYTIPEDRGGIELQDVTVRARDVDTINALELYQDTAMSGGITVGCINNRVTPNYKLLMPLVLDKDVNGAFIEEQNSEHTGRPVPVIPVGAIVDDTFTLDSTETVNQIKIEYFVRKGTGWSSEHLAVSEANQALEIPGTPLVTPTTRTLKGENQVSDPYSSLQAPELEDVNTLVIRAKAALSAQSVPRWRLSNGCSIVLKELPYMTGLMDLIEEAGRFGQLIRIDGAPEQIESYQRIRSGRIVLGDNPVLEFQLEPVDYSAPTALTRDTAFADGSTAVITIGDFQNSGIAINDLRSIGAR